MMINTTLTLGVAIIINKFCKTSYVHKLYKDELSPLLLNKIRYSILLLYIFICRAVYTYDMGNFKVRDDIGAPTQKINDK